MKFKELWCILFLEGKSSGKFYTGARSNVLHEKPEGRDKIFVVGRQLNAK